MVSRRRLTGLAVALAAGVLLPGCGPGGGWGGGQGGRDGSGRVRLVYWVSPDIKDVTGREAQTREFGDYEKLQAAEFMAAHPDVEIQVQALPSEDLTKKVTTAIAAGNPPDVLRDFLGRTAGYAHQGLVEEFDSALPEDELEDFEPFYRDLYTINGRLHGLPLYAWTVHVVANRALWEAEGKAHLLPDEGDGSWDYEQFLAALRAVAKPDRVWPWWAQFASEQGDYCTYGFFWGKGAFLYAPGDYSRVAINTPGGVEALSLIVRMEQEGLIPPGAVTMAGSELENMAARGEVAAWGGSLHSFQRFEVARREGRLKVPFRLQILQYPSEQGRKTPLPVGPTGLVVFKQRDARKRQAALEFARWLSGPKFQREMCANLRQFPTRKSTGSPLEDDPNYRLVRKWMAENGMVDLGLTSPSYYRVRVAAVPHLQAAILRQRAPADALREFEAEANGILQHGR
jgi:multiple sugar transport system substrate-binding protein